MEQDDIFQSDPKLRKFEVCFMILILFLFIGGIKAWLDWVSPSNAYYVQQPIQELYSLKNWPIKTIQRTSRIGLSPHFLFRPDKIQEIPANLWQSIRLLVRRLLTDINLPFCLKIFFAPIELSIDLWFFQRKKCVLSFWLTIELKQRK